MEFTKIFICGCCSEKFPNLHKHTHHKKPRALGGSDNPDNLIDICPGCHDTLHRLAYMMRSGKYSEVSIRDTALFVYKENQLARENVLSLARIVKDAMILSDESGIDEDQPVGISTVIRKKHKDLIHLHCKDRKISLEDYVRSLLIKDILFRYGVGPEEHRAVKNLKRRK
jgi:hypothetical protein